MFKGKDPVRPAREVHAYLHRYRSSTKITRSFVAQCHCGASLKKRSAFVCQKDKTHVFCEACVKSLLGANFAKTRGKKLPGPRVCPVPGCAPRSSVRNYCTCRHCAEDDGNDDTGAAEGAGAAADINSDRDEDRSGDELELSAASDSLKLPGSKVKTIPEDGKTFLNAACCKVQTAKQRAALVRQLSASFFSRLGGGLDYTATVLLLMINFLFIMVAALLDDPTTPLEVAQALKNICLAPLKRAAENVGARSLWALILGESGHGKSTLAGALFKRHAPRDPHYLEQLCERFGIPVDIPMASASTPAARFALVLVEGKGKSAEDAPGHLELHVDSVDGPRVGVGKLKKGNVDALVVASSPSSVQAADFCPIFMVS
eukprot:tig00000189_g14321.t1